MKTLMIDKANDLSEFTAEPGLGRHMLENIRFTEQYAEASDGRILIHTDYPDRASPVDGEFQSGTLINGGIVKRAFRNVCTVKDAKLDVHLTCLHLHTEPKDCIISSFQPKGLTSETRIGYLVQGDYPNTERAIPDTEPDVEVTMAVDLLLKVLKHAKQSGATQITLGVQKPIDRSTPQIPKPIGFAAPLPDGRKMSGVIMPMSVDHKGITITPWKGTPPPLQVPPSPEPAAVPAPAEPAPAASLPAEVTPQP